MSTPTQRFYDQVKSKVSKDSDLPNLFAYHLTIELERPAATISAVKKCYEECDLHPPSWLASHFSMGFRSKPKRFIKRDGGYRLEGKLREQIAARIGNAQAAAELLDEKDSKLAAIEYAGVAGASKDCQDAIEMLIQYGNQIQRAGILTFRNRHCILLTDEVGDPIAIKSGFSSGYGGEGPRTFSYVLQLLNSHKVEIDEYEVEEAFIERVDNSALTLADLTRIDESYRVRPSRWHDYVDKDDYKRAQDGTLWRDFPSIVPYAIIDSRIMDLALSFWRDPDDRLLKGYRRLEDLIRVRTGVDEHGTKLLAQVFNGSRPKLTWNNIDDGEKTGRANLFTGAYMAYRNPRAHRELKAHNEDAQLAEFLLLNHLYRLEQEAI